MRCVRKETILLLFINVLHAHCETVLKTQNISETDNPHSLKVYKWPETPCDCGPDSNCTFTGFLLKKTCICKPGYWEVDGKCVACYCENGNCVNEGGKEICKCNPGYGNYEETSCRACGCGPDTNCTWSHGRKPDKICFCKPGYSQQSGRCLACNCGPDSNCTFSGFLQQKKCICNPGYSGVQGKCVACNCGPDSNCTFSGLFQQKKCICKPGYWVVNGKCVGPCTSDPCKNNGICEVEGKGFKCHCSKPWRGKTCEIGPCDEQPCQNGGTCNVGEIGFICNCVAPFSGPRCENGPCTSNPCQNNGTCEVSEYSYRCNCNKPFKGTNCEIECDCGPYGTCSLESGMKRCICHSNYAEKNGKCEYCFCGENSKSCRYNVLGEKECNCSYAYAQNHGYCEECNCGPYGSCTFEKDRKRCNCNSFAVEMNGVCVGKLISTFL